MITAAMRNLHLSCPDLFMQRLRFLFLLFITFFYSEKSFGQVWIRNKGDFSISLSQEYREYSKVFDSDGNIRSGPKLQHAISLLETEYALSNAFSLHVKIPFIVHNRIEADSSLGITSTQTVNKPGDASVGVRYNFSYRDFLFSPFIYQELGTATVDAPLGLNSGYADFAQVAGGSARWKKENVYGEVDLGFRLRHKGFSDDIAGNAEIGFRMKGVLWVYGRSEGIQPLENGDEGTRGGNFGLYEQDAGYWNAGGGLKLNFEHWLFSALVSGNFKGQFSPSSAIVRIGISYRIIPVPEAD